MRPKRIADLSSQEFSAEITGMATRFHLAHIVNGWLGKVKKLLTPEPPSHDPMQNIISSLCAGMLVGLASGGIAILTGHNVAFSLTAYSLSGSVSFLFFLAALSSR